MTVTSATLETAVEALVAAIDSGDWAAARRNAVKCRAYLSLLPDYGIGSRNVRYQRDAINKLMGDLDQLEREALSIRGGLMTSADLTEPNG